MRFSERFGYKKVSELIQMESIDGPLRNGLWSLLKLHVWDHVLMSDGIYGGYYLTGSGNNQLHALCQRLWFHFFKKPLDSLDNDWKEVQAQLRKYFFECKWYEVYDFIDFVSANYDRYGFRDEFIENCNSTLERELSAYRFVNGLIVRVTEKEQVEEIDQAIGKSRGPVQAHLRRALELLANRENPDYRNSVKESISAVESLVGLVLGSKGTLGQLIKRLEERIGLHPALRTAFSSLYGYTSDAGGIRHALLESDKISFEDAKFFLVVCSAFVNFVEAKGATAT